MVSESTDIRFHRVQAGHLRLPVKVEKERSFVDIADLNKKDVARIGRTKLFNDCRRFCEPACILFGVDPSVDVVEGEQRQFSVGGESCRNEHKESEQGQNSFSYVSFRVHSKKPPRGKIVRFVFETSGYGVIIAPTRLVGREKTG